MKALCFYFLLAFLFSCNMGKHYANYRVGGHTKKSIREHIPFTPSENKDPVREKELVLIENVDSFRLDQKKNAEVKVIPYAIAGKAKDTLSPSKNSFSIDDDLAQAFASPAVNLLAALFGFATLASPGFIWFAVPLYIGAIACIIIGLACFLIALSRYARGISDRRNKKYLWLWVIAFLLSLALAAIPVIFIL